MKKSLLTLLIVFSVIACHTEPDQFSQDLDKGMNFENFLNTYLDKGNDVPMSFLTAEEHDLDIEFLKIFNKYSESNLSDLSEVPAYPENIVNQTIEKENLSFPDFDLMSETDLIIINKHFPGLVENMILNYSSYISSFFKKRTEYLIIRNHAQKNKNSDVLIDQRSGIIPDGYYDLCPQEQSYLISHPIEKNALRDAFVDTNLYMGRWFGADVVGLDSVAANVDDNSANAVKHALWNYLISQYVGDIDGWICCSRSWGRKIAKEFTDIHEECGTGEFHQNEMDLHNNQIGRDLHEENSTLSESQLKVKLLALKHTTDLVKESAFFIQQVPKDRLVSIKSTYFVPGSGETSATSCPTASIDIDCPPGLPLYPLNSFDDQYLVGDWDGDGDDNLAIRRSNTIYKETTDDLIADETQTYGYPQQSGDFYLSGDFNGDGITDVAWRVGNHIQSDTDRNGTTDISFYFGLGNSEDEYLTGDVNGDGTDDFVVRRGNELLSDTDRNGYVDFQFWFGNGNSEDQYLIGDLNGDGTDDIIIRRGNEMQSDTDRNGFVDLQFWFGFGNAEFEYLIGDWDSDGTDEIAVRRDFKVLSDVNGDGFVNPGQDYIQYFGNGTHPADF